MLTKKSTALLMAVDLPSKSNSTSERSLLFLKQDRVPARFGEVPSLNGLRALSILVVMLSHFVSARIFPGGFGVLVFFVVSGFLITRLMFAEYGASGSVSMLQFYARRVLRLYPVILVYTGVVLALFLLMGRNFNFIEPLSALFYFANYLYSNYSMSDHYNGSMPFEIFWSLSVEEHFYIVFPALFLILRGDPRRLVFAMLVVCVVCLGLRILQAHLHPARLDSYYFYFRTQFRIDSLAFGVLIAAACQTDQGRRIINLATLPFSIVLALFAILVCFAVRDPWFRETLRYSIQSFSIAVVIVAIVFSKRYLLLNRLLNLPPVVWVGMLSYSLYVWHLLAPMLLERAMPYLGYAGESAAAKFLLSFVLAAISYYGLERPFVRLRHRFGSRAN